MAILGQNYRPRRRPMGPLILVALAVLIVAFLAFGYSRGGEVATTRMEKAIPLPAAAKASAVSGAEAGPNAVVGSDVVSDVSQPER